MQSSMECIKDANVRDMILVSSSLEDTLKVLTRLYSCMETMNHKLRATIMGTGYLQIGKHKNKRQAMVDRVSEIHMDVLALQNHHPTELFNLGDGLCC